MTGYDRLRPGEVAGTGPQAQQINDLMREHCGENWADILIPHDPPRITARYPMGEQRTRAYHQLASECLAPLLPSQEPAPAIGYQPAAVEAVDTTAPAVTAPDVLADPVADLVKVYRLIKDNPKYRPAPPGRDRWIRFSDIAVDPDTLDDALGAGQAAVARELASRAAHHLEEQLRTLPDGYSWCEHAFELSTSPGDFSTDHVEFTARVRGHRLAPGEQCPSEGRRTVYGPMTPEIRRQAAGQ